MFLDEYLFYSKISKKEFAKMVGVSYPHFTMIASGKLDCTMKMAKKIEEVTNGKVSVKEMLFPKDYEHKRKTI